MPSAACWVRGAPCAQGVPWEHTGGNQPATVWGSEEAAKLGLEAGGASQLMTTVRDSALYLRSPRLPRHEAS